jgi:predicted nucleic acid-binding protein
VILFDTSVLSRVFRRRRPGAEERRLQVLFQGLMEGDTPLGLPGIVLQEVLSGMASQRQFADLRGRLLAGFTVFPASPEEHVEAARLKNLCVGRGLKVSGIDCLIAAIAIAGGHELFAVDGDFAEIAKHSPLRLLTELHLATTGRARGAGERRRPRDHGGAPLRERSVRLAARDSQEEEPLLDEGLR